MRVAEYIPVNQALIRERIGPAWQTQVVLRNITDQQQEFRLWGANLGFGGSTYPTVPTGTFPLRVVHNSVNGLLYAINQQAGTVTVYSSSWKVVTTIELEAANPGEISPASLTVQPDTGTVYVVGSLSDKLYPIAPDHTVGIPVVLAARPISIVWNPVTAKLYVASLATNQLQVVDPTTLTVDESIATGNVPVQVGVSPTGNVLVLNQQDESLMVIRPDHTHLITITNLSGLPVGFQVQDNTAYVITKAPGHLYKVGLESFVIEADTGLTAPAGYIVANPQTGQLIVSIPAEQKLCVFDSDLAGIETIALPGGVSGLAVHPVLEVVMVADHLNQHILILIGSGNNAAVVVSGNYTYVNNDFQHNPALVRHLRLICTGEDYYPTITVATRTPSGKTEQHSISLSAHRSPWQWQNVAEVLGMNGEIITGKTWWLITLLPYQTITLLVYYRQFRVDTNLKTKTP